MGLFNKNSNVNPQLSTYSKSIVGLIEIEFNTKVYDYGVLSKDSSGFSSIIPMGIDLPDSVNYLFYFLIPIDDEDNIITNDYYDKMQLLNSVNRYTPTAKILGRQFQSILKKDSAIKSYLEVKTNATIYAYGSMRVDNYNENENIVNGADKITDLRYRFYRFFASN